MSTVTSQLNATMLDTQLDRDEHRDPRLTITLVGTHDIFRFAVNMLSQQVEFFRAGRTVLVELREALTPDRFDPWARLLLGEDRYAQLAHCFERDTYCVTCERDLGEGKGRKLPQAQVICTSCDVDEPAGAVA